MTNARELAQTQIGKEAEEIEQTPAAEEHELALIYQAKGMPKEDAQRVAANIMKNKQGALDTLAREELGIDMTELGGNPWSAAAIVRRGRHFLGSAILLAEGPLGNRRERGRERVGALRGRDADFTVQRAGCLVLGSPSVAIWLYCSGSDVWRRSGPRNFVVLIARGMSAIAARSHTRTLPHGRDNTSTGILGALLQIRYQLCVEI